MKYHSHWKNLGERPPMTYGFIYQITNKKDGRIYIGKKSFGHGKSWETYTGSSKELNDDIKKNGMLNFEFEMLQLAVDEKHLDYLEMKYLVINNVLERTDTYNKNVKGILKNDIIRP